MLGIFHIYKRRRGKLVFLGVRESCDFGGVDVIEEVFKKLLSLKFVEERIENITDNGISSVEIPRLNISIIAHSGNEGTRAALGLCLYRRVLSWRSWPVFEKTECATISFEGKRELPSEKFAWENTIMVEAKSFLKGEKRVKKLCDGIMSANMND